MQTPDGPLRCRCVDISEGGMSLVSPRPARPRQRARIESRFGGQNLVFHAVVVRRHKSREGYVLGLRFERLDPFARAQLDALLRSMQVQAALAQRASEAFVERMPQMELPVAGATNKTMVAEHVERLPEDTPRLVDPVAWLGQHARPEPRPAAAPRPEPASRRFSDAAEPSWDKTMLAPGPPVARPYGFENGWNDDELETRQYPPKARGASTEPQSEPEPELATLELSIDLTLEPPRRPVVMRSIEPSDQVPQLTPDLQDALDRMPGRDAAAKTQSYPVVPPLVGVDLDLDLGEG